MHLLARLLRVIACLLAALAPASILAISQTSSSAAFIGTVRDPTEAIVPDAVITVKNTETGVENNFKTNHSGSFNSQGLLPGHYEINVEKEGFAVYVLQNIQLKEGVLRLDIRLEIGKKTDVVKIKTKAEVITQTYGYRRETPEEWSDRLLNSIATNLIDLVKLMGGVVMTDNEIYGADDRKLAGFNVQKDNVTANSIRWTTGINIPANLNPKTINEFNIFLPPGNTAAVSSKFGVVTGRVVDKTGKSIQNAIVKIGNKQCTTSEDGSYSISDLQPGAYDISIGIKNYQKATLRNQSIATGSTKIDVQLKPKQKK
jgi:uncharacterized membrane protein